MITMQLQNSTSTTDAQIILIPIYMSDPYDISLRKLNITYNVICILTSVTNKYYTKNKY